MKMLILGPPLLLLANLCMISQANISQRSTQFALDMYRQLIKDQPSSNVFFSPASIYQLMMLTHAGSAYETAQQLASALHVSNLTAGEVDDMAKVFKTFSANSIDKPYVLNMANAVYARKGRNINNQYMEKALNVFEAKIQAVDFENNHEKVRREINEWVETKTNNRIQNLITEGSISSLTAMVLVNAIYFKGNWANKFDPELTEPGSFLNVDGSTSRVEMMHLKTKFYHGYLEEYGAQVLELPYAGNELNMLLFVPDEGTDLSLLEEGITAEHLVNITDELDEHKVQLLLPRFRLEYEKELSDALKNLGIEDLFITNKADLSGIDNTTDLSVSTALHKTFLEVNEEGSEAAAATANVITLTAVRDTPHFILNRPFLLAITHKLHSSVLFLGSIKTLPSIALKEEL